MTKVSFEIIQKEWLMTKVSSEIIQKEWLMTKVSSESSLISSRTLSSNYYTLIIKMNTK